MKAIRYSWGAGRAFDLVFVEGTHGHPYHFGEAGTRHPIEVGDLFIATVPVTNALWTHVMGDEQRKSRGSTDSSPVEYVSWDQITQRSGFLDRINHRGGELTICHALELQSGGQTQGLIMRNVGGRVRPNGERMHAQSAVARSGVATATRRRMR